MQDHSGAATALVPAHPAGTGLISPIRTTDDLAAAFLAGCGPATRDAYGRDLRHFGAFLRRIGVDALDVRRVHVDAYCRAQDGAGVAPATLARRLSALSGFYEYALD